MSGMVRVHGGIRPAAARFAAGLLSPALLLVPGAALAAVYAPWRSGIYRIETYLAQPLVVGYKPHPTSRSVLRYVDIHLEKRRAAERWFLASGVC